MSIFEGFKFRKISSPIHELDPRVKFLYVCIIFIIAILFNKLQPLLILFIMQLPLVYIAKIQKEWIRSMKGSGLFAVFIFLTNLVSYYFYGGFESFAQLIEHSLAITFRFILLIESFSIFLLTTSPDHLGLALEQSGFPYEFCFAFTTAIRFVPVLADEAQTIMDAQKARGLELEKGRFIDRIKNYIPILIPLIVNSVRRSLELAEAMESRAWGAIAKRTNLYVLEIKKQDYYLLILSIIILFLSIYVWYFIQIPYLTDIIF